MTYSSCRLYLLYAFVHTSFNAVQSCLTRVSSLATCTRSDDITKERLMLAMLVSIASTFASDRGLC